MNPPTIMRLLALIISALFIAGCQSGGQPSEKAETYKYWPALPELPRYEYIASIRDSSNVHRDSEEAMVARMLRGENAQRHKMLKPYYIAARYGRVYISDTGLNQVHVFDLGRKRYFRMGYRREGTLQEPRGIAVGADGQVYVVDQKAKKIIIYDSFGLYIKHLDISAFAQRATAITVNSATEPTEKRIYLLDTGGIDSSQHGFFILDYDGTLLRSVAERGAGPGQFNIPTDIELAPDGRLFVLDSANFRVQSFDGEGNYLNSFGGLGNGLGQFSRPRGIAIDAEGLIYVSDTNFTNVQVFRDDGTLLIPIGARSYEDKNGQWSLVADIATDRMGHLFVVDQTHKKFEIFRKLDPQAAAQILEIWQKKKQR